MNQKTNTTKQVEQSFISYYNVHVFKSHMGFPFSYEEKFYYNKHLLGIWV